jgi:hypothetical protein
MHAVASRHGLRTRLQTGTPKKAAPWNTSEALPIENSKLVTHYFGEMSRTSNLDTTLNMEMDG